MRNLVLLSALLFFTRLISQEHIPPRLLSQVNFRTEQLFTKDGEEFNAWIIEDDEAKSIYSGIKELDKVEVDRSGNSLKFITYSDGKFEYVVAKQKLFIRPKFIRVTVYSI